MKWSTLNVEMFVGAKEYVDTAIIPLMPFEISNDDRLEKITTQHEYLSLITTELERELTGRVMLMPAYHYLKTNDLEEEVKRLESWCEEIKKQPFQHIFFITFEPQWKKREADLSGEIIWTSAIDINDKNTQKIKTEIKNQTDQIKELIKIYW